MSYQAQPAMVVQSGGGGNKNSKNLPVGADGREWSNGLCDCFSDSGTCLIACCFPCITYGQVKRRYEHLANQGTPDPEHGGSMINEDCMLHGLVTAFCGLGFIFQMMNRGHMRQRYSIKGGGCGDCCTALWCAPCELVQESRELELEEQSFGHVEKQ